MSDTDNKTDHIKTIRELLGMDEEDFFTSSIGPASPAGLAPAAALDLPVAADFPPPVPTGQAGTIGEEMQEAEFAPAVETKSKLVRFLGRAWVRYPLIFVVALGF